MLENLPKQLQVLGYRASDAAQRAQLRSIGLIPGRKFQLLGHAPFGDPYIAEISGTRFALGRAVLEELELSVVQDKVIV